MSFGFVFGAFAMIVLIGMGIVIYNNLVGLKNQIERAWRNIEILLKQRYDEIPQLIRVIEQFTQYEQQTLQKVLQARQAFAQASSREMKMQKSNEMSLAIQGVMAWGEGYPELRSNQSFLQLQSRVSELESHIADRREFFNETVTNFNTRLAQFPDVFFARLLGYEAVSLYRPPQQETAGPSLKVKVG